MAKVGRNAKCPCGSGRKARDCCRGKPRVKAPYTPHDRAVALELLGLFCEDTLVAEDDAALKLFWEAARTDADEADDDLAEDACDGWFFFDYEVAPGQSVAERFLERQSRLPPGARRYLELMARTRMAVYEVTAVSPGASLTLRDLRTGVTTTVRERTASHELHRWDLVAARVSPMGASGQPEIDHGFLPLPTSARERLTTLFDDTLARGDLTEDGVARSMPVLLHAIRAQALTTRPRLDTTDGDEVLLCRSVFDVTDPDRASVVLDAADGLDRTDQGWTWLQTEPTPNPVVLGTIKLTGSRLVLETMSRERATRGRAFLEEVAGDALRYRATEQMDPYRAMEGRAPAVPLRGPEVDAAVLEMYRSHYVQWPDLGVPALDGVTPREAARRPDLRPRLVALLKDMDLGYERSLTMPGVAYDTTWLWEELGLDDDPDAPGRLEHPPRLGHERVAALEPAIPTCASALAVATRARPGFDEQTTLSHDDLGRDLSFARFLRESAERAMAQGEAPDASEVDATWVQILANFELHRRKVFWVDEGLVWSLVNADLDLPGEMLRVPFASFALVFTDRHVLGLAERLLGEDPTCRIRGRLLRVLTVYVTEVYESDTRGLQFAIAADAGDEGWPWLLTRELPVAPDAPLRAILQSHFPDAKAAADPTFSSPLLHQLLHVCVGAILYATSAGVEPVERPPASRRSGSRETPTSERVYHLPGVIPIRQVRQLRKLGRARDGGVLLHKFLVRGHWRRPAADWKDQRPRWIAPYWRGPDLAAIIEREYRLEAPDT